MGNKQTRIKHTHSNKEGKQNKTQQKGTLTETLNANE